MRAVGSREGSGPLPKARRQVDGRLTTTGQRGRSLRQPSQLRQTTINTAKHPADPPGQCNSQKRRSGHRPIPPAHSITGPWHAPSQQAPLICHFSISRATTPSGGPGQPLTPPLCPPNQEGRGPYLPRIPTQTLAPHQAMRAWTLETIRTNLRSQNR